LTAARQDAMTARQTVSFMALAERRRTKMASLAQLLAAVVVYLTVDQSFFARVDAEIM